MTEIQVITSITGWTTPSMY